MRSLRTDARKRLADPVDREEWACRATPVQYTRDELRSLRELFAEMPDSRRGQGMKHGLATVLSVCALARLAGVSGPAATERFARHLSQETLRALGAWYNPATGLRVAPSDSTLCRVLADTDPDALQEVLRRWAAPRVVRDGPSTALAADGKRILGASRRKGSHFETVTLVTHDGQPLASRCCRDEGGERAALRALLDDVDLRGRVITLDALHASHDTECAIVNIHHADYLFTVKGNCPDTVAVLSALDWTASEVRHYRASPARAHGRIDTRRIDAITVPAGLVRCGSARQAVRVTRERTDLSTGKTSIEIAYALTSANAEQAPPKRLLAWNRGHWMVENANHYRRDFTLREDASRVRARHAPANNAILNNIALALVFHRGFRYLPDANMHFMMHHQDALDAILSPD